MTNDFKVVLSMISYTSFSSCCSFSKLSNKHIIDFTSLLYCCYINIILNQSHKKINQNMYQCQLVQFGEQWRIYFHINLLTYSPCSLAMKLNSQLSLFSKTPISKFRKSSNSMLHFWVFSFMDIIHFPSNMFPTNRTHLENISSQFDSWHATIDGMIWEIKNGEKFVN